MKIFDISASLYNGMPAFPGDPAPEIKKVLSLPNDPANVSVMSMGTHTGTHVDPPVHFIEGGRTIDRVPLDRLYGKAEVLDLTYVEKAIVADDLTTSRSDILLFKTRNSDLWDRTEFSKDYVYLDESAARWLVDRRVKTIGIDYLSVGSFEGGADVHRILLGGDVVMIEGIDLRGIEPGEYTLACLPLKIRDGDGGPARAILIKDA